MAEVFRTVNGQKLERFLARLPVTQEELSFRAFEIKARADVLLREHEAEGKAKVIVERGKIDRYVTLVDDGSKNSTNAPEAIEYGRKAGSKRIVDSRTGDTKVIRWGPMEGLYILHRASNLPIKRKSKVEVDVESIA